MYSVRNLKLVSSFTGKEYPFLRTPDGSSKRAAIEACEADNRAYVKAAEARAGKSLSIAELLAGKAHRVETRTIAQQVAEDGVVLTNSTPANPDLNPYDAAIASIRDSVAYTRTEIAQKKRRLDHMESKRLAWEETRRLQREEEERMNDPAIQEAITAATKAREALQLDPQATDDEIDSAKSLEALAKSGNIAEYHATRKAIETAQREARLIQIRNGNAEIARLKALYKDDPSLAPEQPEPEA